ncbi:MAG: hypothetical protein ACP5KK_00325 [Candidatus Nanoarchaeia archaeon]
MGLFDSLKRILKKQPAEPQRQKPEVKRARVVVKQIKKRKKQKLPEHQILREWRQELKRLQEHPLTQAKIINEQLLATIMDLLNEINAKLDELSRRLEKLELQKVKESKATQATPTIKLNSSEQSVLDFVKKAKEARAQEVAESLGISRSNAALKLNKLFSMGFLDKRQDGKDVFYFLKG